MVINVFQLLSPILCILELVYEQVAVVFHIEFRKGFFVFHKEFQQFPVLKAQEERIFKGLENVPHESGFA